MTVSPRSPRPAAAIFDVDGVVSPVHGGTAWGDDVVAGNVFGPVPVSATLCTRLDALAATPGVQCWWLTSWTPEMRQGMRPFPGRTWHTVAEPPLRQTGRAWWKWTALQRWLAQHADVLRLAWCDDHLTPGRARRIGPALEARGVEGLLIAPATHTGLTPADVGRIERHLGVR